MKVEYWEQQQKVNDFLQSLRANPNIGENLLKRAENLKDISLTEFWSQNLPQYPKLEKLFDINDQSIFSDISFQDSNQQEEYEELRSGDRN